MNKLDANSSEISPATTHDSRLEGIRQLVDNAYAEMSGIDELEFAAPPDTAIPVNHEGQVVDNAQRQRIIDAEKEVAAAYATTPKPESSDHEQLRLG